MKKKTKSELIDELAELLTQLGWVAAVCIEKSQNPEDARGIICGEPRFARDVATAYYGDNIEIIDPEGLEFSSIEDALMEDNTLEKAYGKKNDDDENYH